MTATTAPPHHLVVGPPQHGVTRYAELLAAAAGLADSGVTRVPEPLRVAGLAQLLRRLPDGPVHLHVTDHLLGPSPEEAASTVARLASGRALSLTLHDLPQPSDGAPFARRVHCYARLAQAATAVTVNSEHERALLEEVLAGSLSGRRPPVAVVPHAIVAPAAAPPVTTAAEAGDTRPGRAGASRTERPPDVGVLGFVYPGKGHAEAIAAVAALPGDVGVLALGHASAGHETLVTTLRDRAAALHRRFVVTGWVADDDLGRLLHEVAVPLAPHRHVSASGSIATWLSAGRRPLVTRSRYTVELDSRLPGALVLVEPAVAALTAAVHRALNKPETTWLAAGTTVGPSPGEAARAIHEWVTRWS